MELRDYFKLISRYWKLFTIIIIVMGLAAFLYTKSRPTSYTASTSVTVSKNGSLKQSQVNYYLYDNYYNLQSAGLFSQIISTWFSSPSFVKEIYQNADVALPSVSDSVLSKIFRAGWQQPDTVTISTSGTNQDELSKLINASLTTLQKETNKVNNNDVVYQISSFTPVVTQNAQNLYLNTVIGLICGVILGIIIILGVAYFIREEV